MLVTMSIILRTHVLLRIMTGNKTDHQPDVLRLPKKHRPKADAQPTEAAARRLIDAQSLRNAVMVSLILIIVFSVVWAMLTALSGRFFPWLTLLLGFLIGHGVRRAGRGLDWRFPVLAAVFAFGGSIAANIVVAATIAGQALGIGTLETLQSVTAMTWSEFFTEDVTPGDWVVAAISAGLAAFYANRRLTREEVLALRTFEREQ